MKKNKKNARQRRPAPRDVTADTVIQDLVELFDYLGIDAGHLANRVTSVRSRPGPVQRTYTHAPAIGELLSWWHQDPQYLDNLGNPLPLKMNGVNRSFRRLASQSVPNVDPNELLHDLDGIGAIAIDRRGYIRAKMRALPVYENRRFAIQHTLASLTSFIRTLRHNLDSNPANSDQLFHRVAWNREFDAKELQKLKIWVRNQGQSFLESCDNWMMRRSSTGPRSAKKPVQASVGVYLAVDDS